MQAAKSMFEAYKKEDSLSDEDPTDSRPFFGIRNKKPKIS